MKKEIRIRREELKTKIDKQQKRKKEYDSEYDKLQEKYSDIKNSWFGDKLYRDYNLLGGLLEEEKQFLFVNEDGNLTVSEIKTTSMDSKNPRLYFFNGWKIGIHEPIKKNRIVCPMSWVNMIEYKTNKNKVVVSINAPDWRFYKIIVENGEITFINNDKEEVTIE